MFMSAIPNGHAGEPELEPKATLEALHCLEETCHTLKRQCLRDCRDDVRGNSRDRLGDR
jgi:hypothetical protein